MRLFGIVQHGGVELNELHVGYSTLGTINHRNTVASGNDGIGRGQIDSATAACTHHGHLGQIGVNLRFLRIQDVGTIALDVGRATGHTNTQMVLRDNLNGKVILLDVDVGIVTNSLHQSALNLCTGIVGMVQDAELRVSAFAVQIELPVILLVEIHAPVDQLLYLAWGIAYHLFHRFAVGDIVACDNCVGNMLVESIEFQICHTGDTALGERRIGFVERCLAYHTHLALVSAGYLQRVTHTGYTGTYHEEIVFINHSSSKYCCKDNKKFRV